MHQNADISKVMLKVPIILLTAGFARFASFQAGKKDPVTLETDIAFVTTNGMWQEGGKVRSLPTGGDESLIVAHQELYLSAVAPSGPGETGIRSH